MVNGPIFNPRQIDALPVDGELEAGISSNWAFDHEADIDIHMADWFQIVRTGEYFRPLPLYNTGAFGLTADVIIAHPFFVARDMTIDRLAVEVTNPSPGDIARLGLYKDDGTGYPGALVVDAGTVSVVANAVVAATINQALTKGLHWLVVVSDGTPNMISGYNTWSPLGVLPTGFTLGNQTRHWAQAAVGAGALADPFVGAAAIVTSHYPLVMPRLLSLD
jgi:hypothetical protein|tara:strand:+ start:1957 stop:2616 length:660 start_codon:yes stop_codon:yes gene_type:complete